MEVKLAGYNVDADVLDEVRTHYNVEAPFTPEILSAAYARISRDPAPVGELRAKARQDIVKARESNQEIVFGFGHASVAEHAVLNFDITGLSRLVIEALEHARLCSYTEKSQRYQKLQDDYVIPAELAPWQDEFQALVQFQNEAYRKVYKILNGHFKKTLPGLDVGKRRGKAKEDARYLTSLAMEGQLGMTLSARSLEAMIRRLAGHPIKEARRLAEKLHSEGQKVVPSLLKFTEADPARCETAYVLTKLGQPFTTERTTKIDSTWKPNPELRPELSNVGMIGSTENEELVTAALLYEGCGVSTGYCFEALDARQGFTPKVFMAVFGHMDEHSAAPRAFEMVQFTFELTMSASCFAQMKRHRMATILPQQYSPHIPPRMPESFAAAGIEDLFHEVMGKSSALFCQIAKTKPAAAAYALTQAHRRRVLVQMNARDLYHFSRLRMDGHAQWEIRVLAREMVRQAQDRAPMLMALACGKDEFADRKRKVMEALNDSDPLVSIRKI